MSNPYGVTLFFSRKPAANRLLLLHVASLRATFSAGLASSRATLATATTASYTLTIKHNGVAVGTIVFPAASTAGVFAAAADFTLAPSDTLSIHAPASPDATAAGLAITLMGTRQDSFDMRAVLTGESTLRASLDHIYLNASLTCTATLQGRIQPAINLAASLSADAFMVGQLSDCLTLHSAIRPLPSMFFGRLTVTHDPALFR